MNSSWRSLCLVAVLFLSPPWTAFAATGAMTDTSECRTLLDARSYAKAFLSCKKAAEAGDASAQFNLSSIYLFGWGVRKNKAQAIKWLRASADQRYPQAQYALASRYAAGSGVPKDEKEAVRLLKDAGVQGFLLAQMLLGTSYEAGNPRLAIKRNPDAALIWYRRAASQCDACQYELWRIYYFGVGVDKDYARAARYLQTAANGGLPKAQMQLAFRYFDGEGLPQDNVLAYKWFYIAAKGGEPTAVRALPLISKKMTRAEIAQARAQAEETMNKAVINTIQLCELYQQFCPK